MVPKKNPKANLENKRTLFFQIGLIVALGASFAAFEWNNSETTIGNITDNSMRLADEDIPPITIHKEKLPEIPKLVSPDILQIIEDEIPIEDEMELITTEDSGQEVDFRTIEVAGEDNGDEVIPFINMQKQPEFPGGMEALLRYVASNIRYPIVCAEANIQGTVYLSFVINKLGKVVNVTIARGVHPAIDSEAFRVVSGMPSWSPGMQRDKAVNVSFTMPVRFQLQ
jgi:periplasmic protein TonB